MRAHYEDQLRKMQSKLDQTQGRLDALADQTVTDAAAAEARHRDRVAEVEARANQAAAAREEHLVAQLAAAREEMEGAKSRALSRTKEVLAAEEEWRARAAKADEAAAEARRERDDAVGAARPEPLCAAREGKGNQTICVLFVCLPIIARSLAPRPSDARAAARTSSLARSPFVGELAPPRRWRRRKRCDGRWRRQRQRPRRQRKKRRARVGFALKRHRPTPPPLEPPPPRLSTPPSPRPTRSVPRCAASIRRGPKPLPLWASMAHPSGNGGRRRLDPVKAFSRPRTRRLRCFPSLASDVPLSARLFFVCAVRAVLYVEATLAAVDDRVRSALGKLQGGVNPVAHVPALAHFHAPHLIPRLFFHATRGVRIPRVRPWSGASTRLSERPDAPTASRR